jgi:8-oxo-dGTP diphosphatase
MGEEHNKQKPIIKAASACVWRGDDVLLIKRGSTLGYGRWSLPGGKVEPGETTQEAALRELLEETGVTASLATYVSDFTVETAELIYVISCFTGLYVEGEAFASSDASAVEWAHWELTAAFELSPNIVDAIGRSRKILKL